MRTNDYLNSYLGNETWCIEPLVGEGHNVLIYGKNGAGKSLVGWEIVRSIAKAEKLFGKFPARKGRVLIIDEETPETDFNERVLKQFGEEDLDIEIWPRPDKNGFRFDNRGWIYELKKKMGYEANGHHVPQYDVILFDNLNAMQGKLKLEESNVAVGTLRNIIADLRSINSRLVTFLIHHEGKDAAKGARGASAIIDMSDTVMQVQRVWPDPFRAAIRQIPRKRAISVKPFIVELKDDNKRMWFEYIGEEENVGLPDDNDIDVYEYFVANQKTQEEPFVKTVYEIKKELAGKLGEQAIRESLRKLSRKQHTLIEGKGAHNLGRYSCNVNMPDSHFNKALLGAIEGKGTKDTRKN